MSPPDGVRNSVSVVFPRLTREHGLLRNSRTVFLKMSYLVRRNWGTRQPYLKPDGSRGEEISAANSAQRFAGWSAVPPRLSMY